MTLIKDLSHSYIEWLKQKISFKDLGGAIEITTPFMDRHNDYLQIYVQETNNKLRLTDSGYIITDLKLTGCDVFSSPKRKSIFQTIINDYGIKISEKNELFIDATISNFPQKKHMLVQAMMTVNDMFMTARDNVQSIFLEEVDQFLFTQDIRYTENISFTGKSGFPQTFHFVIPRSKQQPERILHAINNPTRQYVENLLFAWSETKDTRRPDSKLYAILNDSERGVRQELSNALSEYEVKSFIWSNRRAYVEELSA
jgi:hypothetical protein